MIATTVIVASARISWQCLAKLAALGRLLLRWKFPISKCKELLIVEVSANQAQFELLRVRPSAGVAGLVMRLHNHLPFQIEFEIHELSVSIDSRCLLTQPLNTQCSIPATGSATIRLTEMGLTDQQANWVRNSDRASVRAQVELSWRCRSPVRDWVGQKSECLLVSISKDRAG